MFRWQRKGTSPNKVVRHIASSATNSVRPQRRMTRRGSVFGSRAGHLWADRGTGLDTHHVGQKARMSNLVANNDLNKAPAILVPASGHSSIDPIRGRLSTSAINPRTKKPFANARELLARDIRELRRVYPEIPNSQLHELIDLNKSMYPEKNKPPRGKH